MCVTNEVARFACYTVIPRGENVSGSVMRGARNSLTLKNLCLKNAECFTCIYNITYSVRGSQEGVIAVDVHFLNEK